MYTVIDGKLFKKMLIGSYQLMNEKCEIINQLNVFPVPEIQAIICCIHFDLCIA